MKSNYDNDCERLGRNETIIKETLEVLPEYPGLTNQEVNKILHDWNNTRVSYPSDKCVHHLFEEQVLISPDEVAVVYEDESLTYSELNISANRLAHYLSKQGAKENTVVALFLERGIAMIIGLLAISKTGATYLPLDPIYPKVRMETILKDAKPVLFLTQKSLLNKVPDTASRIILLDEKENFDHEPSVNLLSGNSHKPLYILFTSGSTGIPKGVPVLQRSTINLVNSFSKLLKVTSKDIVLTVTTIAFDIAELDIYLALFNGAKLVIGSRETAMDMELLINKLDDSHATIFQATPVTHKMLIQAGWKGKPDLKIISGGDAMSKQLGADLLKRTIEVWNCYGPTETTIYNTAKRVVPKDTDGDGIVSIGRPLDNNTMYVLDKKMRPVPVGTPGELYIGGEGLSPGYVNNPELTAEKFVRNPFTGRSEDLLYKSGDQVKYLPDGNLDFITRIDTQVKIRGFRIELGEIESILLTYPGIREAIVISRNNNSGEKMLVAYFTINSGYDIKPVQLHDFLQIKVPNYMIPSAFSQIDHLPLTINKKVDRKALSNMDIPEVIDEVGFVAPVTENEIRLATIWKELLKTEKVGTNSGFFELGGHSLTAAQLIARIKKEFHVEIPFRIIFERITIAGLLEYIGKEAENAKVEETEIRHYSKGNTEFPLSSSQSRIWFMENINPDITAYNLPYDFKITGDLDVRILERTIRNLILRHESFRTIFPEINGEPVQKVLPDVPLTLNFINLENLPEKQIELLIHGYSLENANYKFNLETGPLFRFQLIMTGKFEFVFFINIHHIISDAISLRIILNELKTVYQALRDNEPYSLPLIPVSYSDFTLWQKSWLGSDQSAKQLEYWKNELLGIPDILQLPIDFHRPKTTTYHGSEFHLSIDSGLREKLFSVSKRSGTGLSIPLLSAFAVLLQRYSLQDDFVIGFPVANRVNPELEFLTGVFINSLPIRFIFPDEITFSELVNITTKRFISAYENQEIPVEHIVEGLKAKRSLNYNPVFQVLFNYLTDFPNQIDLGNATIDLVRGQRNSAQFDLTLTVNEGDQGFDCVFEYNTDLFHKDTITRMAGHYMTILCAVVDNETMNTRSIPLLTAMERKLMLETWNNTDVEYPKEKCIHQLFEEQVKRTPDSIAVVFEDYQLTYAALNSRANILANALVRQGAREGAYVAICLHRGIDLIAGLLAIAKTGAAYIPLDPIYPKARLALILDDAKPLILLTETSMLNNLPRTTARILRVDDPSAFSGESDENLEYGNARSQVYVLYTSGSTGVPKGVPVKQKAVVNLITAMGRLLNVTSDDILLAGTTISFDIAEMEMYLPLLNGAKLVIASEETSLNVELLKQKMEISGATLFQATPVSFKMLLMSGWNGKSDMKVICGGEAFSKELARELLPRCKEVWNGYGPTETTIYSVVHKITPEDCIGEGYVPIGRPVDNTKLFVLNSNMVPVPIGITGELYIGGEGVSAGYLNLNEKTAERFLFNTFSDLPDSEIYKTGDLVQYFPDGKLVYQSRADSQVKIRGFRIEPGEIESIISHFPGVKENTVIAREQAQGEKILVAYGVSDSISGIEENKLILFLKEKLPEYMVPSAIVWLEKLPLTANNKVDRNALPEPSSFTSSAIKEYIAPKTITEKKLNDIWTSILKIEKIGLQDDFFEIGGHSMIAVTLIIKIEKEFGIRLPLATLFDQRTIEKLARVIENGIEPDKWRSLVPLRATGSKKPLFLIHGLGLNVLLYTTIVNYLDPEQPVYGLQAKGLDGNEKPLETIEKIASYYISEIMTVDSEGPYFLAGYSLGGNIAYEMGIQLVQMGKKVNFIGLLDSAAEGSLEYLSRYEKLGSISSFLLKYLAWNLTYLFKPANESRVDVIKRRWKGLVKKVRGIDTKVPRDDRVSKGEEHELPNYLRKVHRTNLRAGRNYRMKPYSGKVHLFKASQQTFYIVDPVNYGWDKYAKSVVIHEVPGEHSSTFAPPNDKIFANILQDALNKSTNK